MSKANLLELCLGEKKYVILNKQVKFLTFQYIGTCKSAYTKVMSKFKFKRDL